MVEVKYEDEKFLIKGVIDFGFAGKYENKTFLSSYEDEGAAISVDYDLDEIIDDEWDCLQDYTEDTDGDSIAKAIESYLNDQEKKASKSNYINNQMVERVVDVFYGIGFEFWDETPEYVIQSKMPKPNQDGEFDSETGNIYDCIYTDEFVDWAEELSDLAGESEIHTKKEDLIVRFKELLPMFDIEKFFSEIKGTILYLEDSCISIQFDDSSEDMSIFCSGYTEIHDDLTFDDWHNQ